MMLILEELIHLPLISKGLISGGGSKISENGYEL